MAQELICITCPMGCRLSIERRPEGGAEGELAVSGNRCPRGAAYAREELLAPKRTVTATCRLADEAGNRTEGAYGLRRVPCRTAAPFPKERVGELLSEIYKLEPRLPVKRGDVLLRDALGLGVDVVATRTISR
jgi:CxxC motif-containing protein